MEEQTLNLNKYNEENMLALWMDMAEALMNSGAEVNRVEKTLKYISSAYNICRIDAFTITSSIVVTCTFNDGNIVTQTRRINKTPSMNLMIIEEIYGLSRECALHPMPIEELRIRFDRIKSRTVRKKEVAGAIIAAGAFTLFFGGTALDASVSGILAVAICFCKNKLSRYFNNVIMFNFIIAFIAGSIIYILGSMVDSINVDKVIIGDIMLMIPGISIATSMKDMLSGDTIAGTLRLIECILWAGALAAGFMFAMLLTGGLR